MDELITEARLAKRGIGADRIITVLQMPGQTTAKKTMRKSRVLYRRK